MSVTPSEEDGATSPLGQFRVPQRSNLRIYRSTDRPFPWLSPHRWRHKPLGWGVEVVDTDRTVREECSATRVVLPVQPRRLAKVPFVELADGRLQGVVSSGSDIERVYVSSITAGTNAYHCSTNNNRPCGGLRGSPCKHLQALVDEAVLQYGADRVARYLQIDVGDGASSAADLLGRLHGRHEPTPAAIVFSRFLRHLAYLELPDTTEPIPELHWFPATGAVR